MRVIFPETGGGKLGAVFQVFCNHCNSQPNMDDDTKLLPVKKNYHNCCAKLEHKRPAATYIKLNIFLMLISVNIHTVFIEWSCFVRFNVLSFPVLIMLKSWVRHKQTKPGFQARIFHFLLSIMHCIFNSWNWNENITVFDPVLHATCFSIALNINKVYIALLWKTMAIDWWRVNPCLHLAERRMVLLLLHICTQAHGPANSVSYPSNKRSFQRRWCVLLCVTALPGEVLFFYLTLVCCASPLGIIFPCFFPSFALWVFRRLASV